MMYNISNRSYPRSQKQENYNWMRIMRLIIFIILIAFILKYFVVEYYYSDTYDKYYDPKLEEIRDRLSVAIPEIKNVDISGSNKSFTINKKHVYICSKDESGQYYDDNMLTYVILHELAHVLCDEVGHTEKYKQIFRSLLERAHKAGLYDPSKPPLDNYCNY